jgi:hypothetical protein
MEDRFRICRLNGAVCCGFFAPRDCARQFFPQIIKTILDKPLKFHLEFSAKMFLLFFRTLLERVASTLKVGTKIAVVVCNPPGRIGSSRPSLRKRFVLE